MKHQLPKMRPRVQLPTIAGVIGKVVAGQQAYFRPSSEIINSFAAPNAAIASMAFDDVNLISCAGSSYYIHDGVSSSIQSSFSISLDPTTQDMAVHDGNLIRLTRIGATSARHIVVHDGITSAVLSTFPAPATQGFALTVVDGNLVTSDSVTSRIYVHDGISQFINTSFVVSELTKFLTYDGTNLIGTTAGSDTIYIYDGVSPDVIASIARPVGFEVGIAFATKNLISADSGTDLIYTHGRVLA